MLLDLNNYFKTTFETRLLRKRLNNIISNLIENESKGISAGIYIKLKDINGLICESNLMLQYDKQLKNKGYSVSANFNKDNDINIENIDTNDYVYIKLYFKQKHLYFHLTLKERDVRAKEVMKINNIDYIYDIKYLYEELLCYNSISFIGVEKHLELLETSLNEKGIYATIINQKNINQNTKHNNEYLLCLHIELKIKLANYECKKRYLKLKIK